jgi:hypothetical protein
MLRLQKNKLHPMSNTNACEPRVMLAGEALGEVVFAPGHSPSDIPPAIEDGAISIVVAGERTYAVVPTRSSVIPETEEELEALNSRLIDALSDALDSASAAATAPESDGGERQTQSEFDATENQILKAMADEVNAAAYVGQTGSGVLSRVNSGTLPSVRTRGTTSDILDLGFENSVSNARGVGGLPNIITYGSNVERSIERVRNRSRREQVEVLAVLTPEGRVVQDVGLVLGREDVVMFETEARVANSGGIFIHTHSVDTSDEFGEFGEFDESRFV